MGCETRQDAVGRDLFVEAMRRVASSVAVVTTAGQAGRHGATVSSFCSVSAEPPLLLVCLNAETRIARQVRGNGMFCLNILTEGQRQIAERFAGMDDAGLSDRFAGIALRRDNPPEIDGAAVFTCALQSAERAGSHLVCIGHVTGVSASPARPLTYFDRGFHRLARGDEDRTQRGER